MATTAITQQVEANQKLEKIKAYTQMPDVQERFVELLGEREGRAYVSAVYIAVLNNEGLQNCSAKSIMIQAMRAAALKLSVDPAMKQAHLVPYGNNAQLIVDYHGLVTLMDRTGLYEDINVSEVYQGEIVETERFSGRCEITGERTSDNVIGWMAYFKTKKGSEKFLYMTNEECIAYGKKHSKAFNNSKSVWQTDPPAMCRKTALRCLCNKWGQYSPFDTAVLKNTEDIIDGDAQDLPDDAQMKLAPPAPRDAKKENELKEQGLGIDVYRVDSVEIVGAVADIAEISMDQAQAYLLATYKPSDMLSVGDARKFAAQIEATNDDAEPEQAPLIPE